MCTKIYRGIRMKLQIEDKFFMSWVNRCCRISFGIQFTKRFLNVGVDTFGPWQIVTSHTQGGQTHGKRLAIMFSCLTSRAVHIEVIEDKTSSSLRRFIAIRGHVKEFRSDRGRNFIGSTDHLGVDVINVENGPIKRFLLDQRSVWISNPPYASHMGGTWESMISLMRRILDTILMDKAVKVLTQEILTTFLADVSAIMNSRPLVCTSSDPDYPLIRTPYTLLTLKTDKGREPLGPFNEKDAYIAQWKSSTPSWYLLETMEKGIYPNSTKS